MTPNVSNDMTIVYKHTNKTSGKSYIGVTSRSMNERWNEHCRKASNLKTHFSNAILLYGEDDWEHSVIFKGNESECYEKEYELIKSLNTISNGYNLHEGGIKPPMYKALGMDNYQFKGFYITPNGNFATLKSAANHLNCGWQKIKKRCVTDNDRVLTKNAVFQSSDLDDSMIGKSFNQLGWGFGECREYIS